MDNKELCERLDVTDEQLDKWAGEYESSDWSNMKFGEVYNGHPKLTIHTPEPESKSKKVAPRRALL